MSPVHFYPQFTKLVLAHESNRPATRNSVANILLDLYKWGEWRSSSNFPVLANRSRLSITVESRMDLVCRPYESPDQHREPLVDLDAEPTDEPRAALFVPFLSLTHGSLTWSDPPYASIDEISIHRGFSKSDSPKEGQDFTHDPPITLMDEQDNDAKTRRKRHRKSSQATPISNNLYGRSGKLRCLQCRKWRQKV